MNGPATLCDVVFSIMAVWATVQSSLARTPYALSFLCFASQMAFFNQNLLCDAPEVRDAPAIRLHQSGLRGRKASNVQTGIHSHHLFLAVSM